jgi:hypothetical protein
MLGRIPPEPGPIITRHANRQRASDEKEKKRIGEMPAKKENVTAEERL